MTSAVSWMNNASTPRKTLNALLGDGNTIADYQGGVGFTGTTNCSAWANQIGAAGPLLQASGAAQPVINGTSLEFDGLAMFMQTADFTLDQPTMYYAVFSVTTYNPVEVFFGGKQANTSFYNKTGAPGTLIGMYAGTEVGAVAGPTAGTLNEFTHLLSGASSYWLLNGAGGGTGDPGADNPGGITVGASNGGAVFGAMAIKELIVRSAADSAGTRSQIEALLKSIWGTP